LFQDAQLTAANKKAIKTNNVRVFFMADFPLSKSFCPPSFPWPLAVPRLSFFERTMGLGEAICVHAVFMPISFRIQTCVGDNKKNQSVENKGFPLSTPLFQGLADFDVFR
jgi:hypothetical protein